MAGTHKILIADVNTSEIDQTYAYDQGNEVGKTIKDGQVRIFVETNSLRRTCDVLAKADVRIC